MDRAAVWNCPLDLAGLLYGNAVRADTLDRAAVTADPLYRAVVWAGPLDRAVVRVGPLDRAAVRAGQWTGLQLGLVK